MQTSSGFKLIGILGALQGAGGILRAFQWFDIGSDLLGQGLLLLPLVGVLAFARGALVALIAALFFVFAIGAFLQRSWARPLGIGISIVNLLLILNILVQGDSLVRALPWAVVPAVILIYLLRAGGSRAPGRFGKLSL
jgi:hypothetical protein